MSRSVCLSRFWKLDEEGMYLIVLNSAPDEDMMQKESHVTDHVTSSKTGNSATSSHDGRKVIAKKYIPFGCDIVLTIAPRKDAHDQDEHDETVESLIQCTMQVRGSTQSPAVTHSYSDYDIL